jgi:HAD superfamily hydrolase (TIGR01459 family)
MPEPRFVAGLSALVDHFDAFILDQWGVLHDGARAYPGAVDAVEELIRHGRKVLLLSNSGRRADANRDRLGRMGFDVQRFSAVVTSGEAAWQLMRERRHPPWDQLGRRCYLLTHLGDFEVVKGVDLEVVEDVAQADFIFASGLDPWQTAEALRPVAEAGVARGLLTVCSNPDIVAVSQTEMVNAPGAFAQIYEQLGGKVVYVGKPHRPIYEVCLEALRGVKPERIVGVGDSLDHDIKGAADMGFGTAFITGGIHAADFAELPEEEKQRALDRLCVGARVRPDWVLPTCAW